jgi:hypothetical protein
MDGSDMLGRRRLIRDYVLDRHSASLLAKAFEQVTAISHPRGMRILVYRLLKSNPNNLY